MLNDLHETIDANTEPGKLNEFKMPIPSHFTQLLGKKKKV